MKYFLAANFLTIVLMYLDEVRIEEDLSVEDLTMVI